MTSLSTISVCILTKNSAKTLAATLHSVASFPEVVLLDTGSSDSTLSIAQQYANVRIEHAPFTGFGALRNQLATHASFQWIFALDSDEVVSPSLLQEISQLSLNDPSFVYSMTRKNFYNGREIRGCGWSPDRVHRLYHRSHTSFYPQKVHESLQTHLSHKVSLRHPIFHTPYHSVEEFLVKMQHYSSLFAEEHVGKKKASFMTALTHSVFSFIKSYFFQKGMFDGKEGLEISLYNANSTFYKYLKLIERNRRERAQ